MSKPIYKIVLAPAWANAICAGIFEGAPVDIVDGYIHLSAADQVAGTLSKHFAGAENLVLVSFDRTIFGSSLKWEVSRGGALFPHVYGAIDPALALRVEPLPLDKYGTHILPAELNLAR
jgi:uncharacterized protein (DUF952 family)